MEQNAHKKQCTAIQELAVSYFQETLTNTAVMRVKDHLKKCNDCRREYKMYHELHRLSHIGDMGAIDPDLLPRMDSMELTRPEGNIMTVNEVLAILQQINSDTGQNETSRKKQMITSIHHFLNSARAFLKSRPVIRAGKEWINLEKKRSKLLKKVLDHPAVETLKPLMKLQAEAYVSRGLIFQLQGDTCKAEANLSQSVVLHWAMNTPDTAQTQRFLGELKFFEGDLDTSGELFIEILKKPETPPREQALLLRNLGNIAYLKNDFSSCKRYLEQALSISSTLNEKEFAARDLMNLSAIEFHRGNLSLAVSQTQEALEHLNGSSDPHLQGQLYANLGTFNGLEGHHDQANKNWHHALDYFNKGFFTKDSIQVMRNMALVSYKHGDTDGALTLLTKAISDYSGIDELMIQLQLLAGRIMRQKSHLKAAEKLLEKARVSATQLNEEMLLDAIRIELMFIKASQNDRVKANELLLSSSAGMKRKIYEDVSTFDLENEAELVRLQLQMGDRLNAAKSLRRFTRLLKKYRKINGVSALNTSSTGVSWSDIELNLKEKLK